MHREHNIEFDPVDNRNLPGHCFPRYVHTISGRRRSEVFLSFALTRHKRARRHVPDAWPILGYCCQRKAKARPSRRCPAWVLRRSERSLHAFDLETGLRVLEGPGAPENRVKTCHADPILNRLTICKKQLCNKGCFMLASPQTHRLTHLHISHDSEHKTNVAITPLRRKFLDASPAS
jgi:hypothetical protein